MPHALATTSWQRFCEAADAELISNAQARPELFAVWGASDFVAAWCIRQPRAFAELLGSGDLDRAMPESWYRQCLQPLVIACNDSTALNTTLRQFRQRQMVRLAWRDLASKSALEETMQGVSALADASIELALEKHYAWLADRFGTPTDAQANAVGMIVLGLGKLGGKELNYSSDIDLMFAYDGSGQTDADKPIDNQQFFIKLGCNIIDSLARVDADGFVFRTDMRLRPNGDSGPLVLSAAAMEHYYQTHGRDWERYALIKARVVAGAQSAGAALLAMLRPFVYRKYLDFSAFDSLRAMQAQIERQLVSGGNANDIKRGCGGIREIEFFAQSNQLIRGGREIRLQTASLYMAMAGMLEIGMIDRATHDVLIKAYRFLRNVEHRLQMVADRQTQTLPQSEMAKTRLARAMNFADWAQFEAALNTHRQQAHRLFKAILGAPDSVNSDTQSADLGALWQGELEPPQQQATLTAAGFTDWQQLSQLLAQFRNGSLYRSFANIERDRLDRLMPLALKQAGRHKDASRAIAAFISVVEAIGKRSVYLSLLIENPLALGQLLDICAASRWICRHIGNHPVILDELLQPVDRQEALDKVKLKAALEHRLAQIDANDVEANMNTLREFHHAQVLRIACADIRQQLTTLQVLQGLSDLAEVLLAQVLNDAIAKVARSHGAPPGEVGIIAYGKLAAAELGYHADLDIVIYFIADRSVAHADAEYYFSRVGQRFIHLFTTRTHAGILFDLDMRLRPSGRSGTLVTSLKTFEGYQRNSAWTWEHQALVRARVVIGGEYMRARFEQIRQEVLCLPRQSAALMTAVDAMRHRMVKANCQSNHNHYDIKLDYGGIVDIEFLLQYLVLAHARSHPQIVPPRNTLDLIAAITAEGLLSPAQGKMLAAVYQTYLATALQLKLMDQAVLIGQSEMLPERQAIKQLWELIFAQG